MFKYYDYQAMLLLVVCRHPKVYCAEVDDNSIKDGVEQRIPFIFLMCRNCGSEIARWKKPDDGQISFEELFYQHTFVFGKPPQLSWALRHELK